MLTARMTIMIVAWTITARMTTIKMITTMMTAIRMIAAMMIAIEAIVVIKKVNPVAV